MSYSFVIQSGSTLPGTDFNPTGKSCVPGTSVGRDRNKDANAEEFHRDFRRRRIYLRVALDSIPRLLGAMDRNPMSPTYGCLDRQYWHYRTADFASEMYQEGVLALAYAQGLDIPGNKWYNEPRLRELAVAGIRFAARHGRADGSCDDYYPFERALGAAVFSLQACAEAYRILRLSDAELEAFLRRRADWIMDHGESGRLANHHALAALALARVCEITGKPRYKAGAQKSLQRVLAWQHEEGWFEEYGGADPGYQTVTIDCLAKLRFLWGMEQLDAPLRHAVAFASCFAHPDGTYGGEYGSRGTSLFYPHGMELLARADPGAAELADCFLRTLEEGTAADFSDDRLFAHRLGNLFEAYRDWAPSRPAQEWAEESPRDRHFPAAGLMVRGGAADKTIVSTARGGVFRHYVEGRLAAVDAGLILETSEGRLAVSQLHCAAGESADPSDERYVEVRFEGERVASVTVGGPLHWTRFETATPLKQAALHLGMISAGRFCRTPVRRLLQQRLITARRGAPVRHARTFEFHSEHREPERSRTRPALRVIDVVELTDPRLRVGRMAFGGDLRTGYTAASGIDQPATLVPWHDLGERIAALNKNRRVEIIREFP